MAFWIPHHFAAFGCVCLGVKMGRVSSGLPILFILDTAAAATVLNFEQLIVHKIALTEKKSTFVSLFALVHFVRKELFSIPPHLIATFLNLDLQSWCSICSKKCWVDNSSTFVFINVLIASGCSRHSSVKSKICSLLPRKWVWIFMVRNSVYICTHH